KSERDEYDLRHLLCECGPGAKGCVALDPGRHAPRAASGNRPLPSASSARAKTWPGFPSLRGHPGLGCSCPFREAIAIGGEGVQARPPCFSVISRLVFSPKRDWPRCQMLLESLNV